MTIPKPKKIKENGIEHPVHPFGYGASRCPCCGASFGWWSTTARARMAETLVEPDTKHAAPILVNICTRCRHKWWTDGASTRDERADLHARIRALEEENERLRAELAGNYRG